MKTKNNLRNLIIFIIVGLIILNSSNCMASSSTSTIVSDEKSNMNLKSIEVENYEISPEFNKNTTQYYLSIPTSEKEISVSAIPESEQSTVKISGNTGITSKESTVKIVVTSANKKTKTYKISVSKQEDNNLKLSNLEIEGATISPEFSKNKYFYTAKITQPEKVQKLNIKSIKDDSSSNIEVIGNDDSLVLGDNLITIVLTSGEEKTIYQILVNITTETTVMSKIENNNVISKVKNFLTDFFSDTNKTIAFLIAVAVLLLLLIIMFIIKIGKNGKAEKSRETIKKRAK